MIRKVALFGRKEGPWVPTFHFDVLVLRVSGLEPGARVLVHQHEDPEPIVCKGNGDHALPRREWSRCQVEGKPDNVICSFISIGQ